MGVDKWHLVGSWGKIYNELIMNFKHIIAPLVALIIGLGAGFITQMTVTAQRDQQIAYLQSQVEHAKRFFPPEQSAVSDLSGTIKSVSGNSIALDVSAPNFYQNVPLLRTVRITNRTTIIKFEQKDSTTFRNEYADFQKKTARLPTGPGSGVQLVPPNPFRQTVGTLADLKAGQSVSVTANENIATKESFDAASVQITIITLALPGRGPGQAR